MKKAYLFVLAMLGAGQMLSQNIGINATGATPDASAMLDVSATNKGLLIPRVALTATNAAAPVTSPVTSLLVYNTATAGTAPNNVVPGYYYWNGTVWMALVTSASPSLNLSSLWNVTGNAGTTAGTNFLGTTDAVDLVIKTNNAERARVTSAGNVGIGNNSPSYKLDVNGTIRTGNASATNGSLIFSNSTNANTLTLNTGITSTSYALTFPAAQGGANTVLTNNGSGTLSWNSFAAAANTWSTVGNAGINTATNFLGTTDNRQLILKSNNLSFLEVGTRTALGLVQAYPDYTDGNEKVSYVRSAIQFDAPNAQFYKPKMWTDINGNFRVKGSSAGTDYFEFGSTGTSNDGGFEFIIGDDGDEPMVFKSYHYINGMSEIMRLQSGRMAVGSNAFDATNPEKLLIDAGTTSSYNLMTGKGSIDNYLQINVKNGSSGGSASSDVVASANNGTESVNYIDMGINSSGYSNASLPILNGANNAYLYSTGNDFILGNGTASRSLRFFTGGFANANERMRIDGTGKVGIGNTSPTQALDVTGNLKFSGALMPNNTAGTSGYLLQSSGPGAAPVWVAPTSGAGWALTGNAGTTAGTNFIGTTDDADLVFKTDDTEVMRIYSGGGVDIDAGVGAASEPASAIYAIGDYNNYLEMNVQNLSNGNLASSDIVATADNGDSLSVYVDMGINSGGYSNGNSNILNGPNVAYLYSNGKDFKIGNGTPNRNLIFFTNPSGGTLGTNTANGLERMRIAANGNVGIGVTSPSYLLQLGINSAAKPGSNTWTVASDRRLKKQIRPFVDGLQVLTKIKPVWYQYNGIAKMPDDGRDYIGIIAQEMKDIAPYTIDTFKDPETGTDYLNYDSNAITYILINSVKEQQAEIDALKKQLEEQNQRLLTLEKKLK